MLSAVNTPKAIRGRLQKRSTKTSSQHNPRNDGPESSVCISTHDNASASAESRPNPSVACEQHETCASSLKTRMPFINPALRRDLTASDAQKRQIPTAATTPTRKNSSTRNVSNADSGVVLSPPSSPAQPSPEVAGPSPNADAASLYSMPDPIESPLANGPQDEPVCSSDCPKPGHGGVNKSLPMLPAGQQQKRRLPCPIKSSQTLTSANSSVLAAPKMKMLSRQLHEISPSDSPVLSSRYPLPLQDSPLTDKALELRRESHTSSIFTNSSSSSFWRPFNSGPRRCSARQIFARSTQGAAICHEVNGPLDIHGSPPYEALPDAAEPPVVVRSAITPTVIRAATTPVTALPGVPHVNQRPEKSKSKQGGRLWSLFRKRTEGSGEMQRKFGLERSSSTNSIAHTSVHSDAATNGHMHGPRNTNYGRPLPQARLLPGTPANGMNASANAEQIFVEALQADSADEEQDYFRRQRRRALFAIDGLTYAGADSSPSPAAPFLHQASQCVGQRPARPHSAARSTRQTSEIGFKPGKCTPSRGHSKMSEEAKRTFIRRGKEADARISAIARESPELAVSPTDQNATWSSPLTAGDLSLENLNMYSPVPEQLSSSEADLGSWAGEDAMIPVAHQQQNDVAWWEEPTRAKPRPKSRSPPKREIQKHEEEKDAALESALQSEIAAAEVEGRDGAKKRAGGVEPKRPLTERAMEKGHRVNKPSSKRPGRDQSHQSGGADQESYARGRPPNIDTLRKHRDGRTWVLTPSEHKENTNLPTIGGHSAPQRQITVQIQRRESEDDVLAFHNGAEAAAGPQTNDSSGSTSSSIHSLTATVLRPGRKTNKPQRPSMNAFEAAHLVQSSSRSPQGASASSSPGSEQLRSIQPDPLSVRSSQRGVAASEPARRSTEPVPAATMVLVQPTAQRRRPPPPPPPHPPTAQRTRSAVASHNLNSLSRSASNAGATPRRPPPPPLPPKSSARPRLGGDWSGSKLQGLRDEVLGGGGGDAGGGERGRRNLSTVVEEAWVLLDLAMGDGEKEKGKGIDSEAGEEEAADRFWSDDEGAGAGAASSKKTTPEKEGFWDLEVAELRATEKRREDVEREEPDTDAVFEAGDEAAAETQLIDYYLNDQREEEEEEQDEERDRRAACDEARAATLTAAQVEEATKRENAARAERVAILMARIRA